MVEESLIYSKLARDKRKMLDLKNKILSFRYGLIVPYPDTFQVNPEVSHIRTVNYVKNFRSIIKDHHIYKTDYVGMISAYNGDNYYIFSAPNMVVEIKDLLKSLVLNNNNYKFSHPIYFYEATYNSKKITYWYDVDNNYAIVLGRDNAFTLMKWHELVLALFKGRS